MDTVPPNTRPVAVPDLVSPRPPVDLSSARRLDGRKYLLVGSGALVRAVAEEFRQRGADVVTKKGGENVREKLESNGVGAVLAQHDLQSSEVDAVLALHDEHELNLRAALEVSEIDPELPVVLRAFDPTLADEIERGRQGQAFGVRAAYSVAHLAAPAFVAAALLGEDEENVATLRLGDEYISICRLRLPEVSTGRRRRRIVGRTPEELRAAHGCHVIGRRWPNGDWESPGTDPLAPEEELLVGGQLLDVLRLARDQSRRRTSPATAETGRVDIQVAGPRRRLKEAWKETHPAARVLGVLMALLTLVVGLAPVHGLPNFFYVWVLTVLGNPPPNTLIPGDAQGPLMSGVSLLTGGIALGLGIALMSAYLVDRRIGDANVRRARRLRGHVVVVGLGEIGYRVAQLLGSLDVPCAVVEPALDDSAKRRAKHLGSIPVLEGELERSLALAGVARAQSLIAGSDGSLVNVEACMRAKRASQGVRTVARIFDDVHARGGNRAFGVDEQIPGSRLAAPAFVDAAVFEESVRVIDGAGPPLVAVRWPQNLPLGARQMQHWYENGVRLLAVWDDEGGAKRPDAAAPGLGRRQTGLLVGPPDTMEAVLNDLRRRTGAHEDPLPQSRAA